MPQIVGVGILVRLPRAKLFADLPKDLFVSRLDLDDFESHLVEPCVDGILLAPYASGGETYGGSVGNPRGHIDHEGNQGVYGSGFCTFQSEAIWAKIHEVPDQLRRVGVPELQIAGESPPLLPAFFPTSRT